MGESIASTSNIISVVGILVGLFGILGGVLTRRTSLRNWIRLERVTSGSLICDRSDTSSAQEINNNGYLHYVTEAKRLLAQKFGDQGYDIIASPAELDYLFPFLLTHHTKKRFITIHTNPDWPEGVVRVRYNDISPGDRVVFVAVVLSSGRFLLPAIDVVLKAGATVSGVLAIVEAQPAPDETTSIGDELRQRNVPFFPLYHHF
jgi:orotate phosphoribosyltransferase